LPPWETRDNLHGCLGDYQYIINACHIAFVQKLEKNDFHPMCLRIITKVEHGPCRSRPKHVIQTSTLVPCNNVPRWSLTCGEVEIAHPNRGREGVVIGRNDACPVCPVSERKNIPSCRIDQGLGD